MTRSVPVPSSKTNFKSFLDFFTASQALTFTTRKSDLLKVSKSTNSWKSGSISTWEKSIFTAGASGSLGASAGFSALLASVSPRGFMVGKRMTSRMESEPVSSMTQRSMPMPRPPVGGRPYSSASM